MDQVFRDPSIKRQNEKPDCLQVWRVQFNGRVEPTLFNSKGAATILLEMLQRGQRYPIRT